ncbi:hypothetical protein NP493_286g01037 [Ridgeia piscesae]|uniref:Uncharacterized protein n=1 Tax=Ridgeia piscesae TaxID=27915 RepID=A0AAD9UC50_RIDPI|nr:hypothetical protein NP493_286g01037 [Ridgeia piscesae]
MSSYTALVNDFWAWRLEETPEFASAVGVHDFDRRLETYTLEAFDHRTEQCRQFLARIDAINVTRLSSLQRQHVRVLRYDIVTYLNGHRWRFHCCLNAVNAVEGVHKDFHYWVDAMLFDDDQSFKVYTTRLRSLATQINEQVNLMRQAIDRRLTNHRLSMEAVVGDIAELLGRHATDSPFYKPFNRSLAFVKVSQSNREKIRQEGEAVILDQVMPSYRTLRTFIRREYLPRGRRALGVSSLSQGLEYYRACLTWHLSYDLSPSQLFAIGQRLVDDIRRRMKAIKDQVNFSGDLHDFMRYVHGANKFVYRSEEDLLEAYKDLLYKKIMPRIGRVTNYTQTKLPVVERMPFDGPLGVMMAGGGDTGTADIFFVNVINPLRKPKWKMLTVALHETLPGRYLQTSYERSVTMPSYRKWRELRKLSSVPFHFPSHAAYTQGWALYAESLGEDMGLRKNVYDEFGVLYSQLLRASDWVLDIGIHALRWSREQAFHYGRGKTALSRKQMQPVINRIVTLPGQAVSAGFGRYTIHNLRHKAQVRLGVAFDIREFHHRVLQVGPVPLKMLEETIDAWLDEVAPTSATDAANLPNVVCLITCCVLGLSAGATR